MRTGGRPGDIASERAKELLQVVKGKLVFVVPDKDLITKRLSGGPDTWDQYLLVLRERNAKNCLSQGLSAAQWA